MAAAKIVFHPGASEDYAAAFAWYHARATKIASVFESEIDRGDRRAFPAPKLRPIMFATLINRIFLGHGGR